MAKCYWIRISNRNWFIGNTNKTLIELLRQCSGSTSLNNEFVKQTLRQAGSQTGRKPAIHSPLTLPERWNVMVLIPLLLLLFLCLIFNSYRLICIQSWIIHLLCQHSVEHTIRDHTSILCGASTWTAVSSTGNNSPVILSVQHWRSFRLVPFNTWSDADSEPEIHMSKWLG